MTMKKGLGKGLDALFESYKDEHATESPLQRGVEEIRVIDIDPNPNQPRRHFNDEKIQELSESIKQHGVVQPIVVKQNGHRYMIIAGERRWRAARAAGLSSIPCVKMDLDDRQVMEIGLIENLQREDLNPIEEAHGFKALIEEYHLTQEEIAIRLGRSRPAIANALRLLHLTPYIQELLIESKLSAGHARALLGVAQAHQEEIARQIITKDLSVRETEKLIRGYGKGAEERQRPMKPNYIIEIEAGLEESLGTRVQITPGAKKGVIEIEYYSNEDLERILERVSSRK